MKQTLCHILFDFRGYVNGSLMDCLDFFIWCKVHGIDAGLRLINDEYHTAISLISNLYYERYHVLFGLPFNEFVHDGIISSISYSELIGIDNIIFFDYSTFSLYDHTILSFSKGIKSCIFVSNLYEHDIPALWNTNSNFFLKYSIGNCRLLYEPDFMFIGTEPYRQKYLLDGIERIYTLGEDARKMIVCPRVSVDEFSNLIHGNNLWNVQNFEHEDFWYRDPMKQYDKFLNRISALYYFQSPVVYDRKPRIILECLKLNIPIHYFRWSDKIDGSWIRYEQGTKGLENRAYSEDDDLVCWLKDK